MEHTSSVGIIPTSVAITGDLIAPHGAVMVPTTLAAWAREARRHECCTVTA